MLPSRVTSCVLLCLGTCATAAPTLRQMIEYLAQFNKDWTYPRSLEIAKGINYTGVSSDVVGRIDITNTFFGAELNTEYIFGMFSGFASSQTTSLIGFPLNQTVNSLVVQGNTLSAGITVMFNWTVEIIPVNMNFFLMFNDEGKVTQYETELLRTSWILPYLQKKLAARLAIELGEPEDTDPAVLIAKRAAIDICSTHEEFCTGSNQQYNSTDECIDFITNKVPFGDIWQAGQNTGICRYFHKAMVVFRPDVHCPHIGPSGGGYCIERDYVQVSTEKVFAKPFIQLPGGLTLEDFAEPNCTAN